MGFELMSFLTVLLMVFALVMVLAGIFTAYFGSGKSRAIGVGLLVVGLVIGIVWGVMCLDQVAILDVDLGTVIWDAFVTILAAIIGILAAVGIFLLAIMKA